jgi:hypothetical protein
MPTKPRKKSRIPRFKSLEEEAQFWETHDTTEFEDEFEEVEIRVTRPLRHFYKMEVDAKLLTRLAAMSQKRGMNLDQLLRGWIEERLAAEEARETESAETRPEASSS